MRWALAFPGGPIFWFLGWNMHEWNCLDGCAVYTGTSEMLLISLPYADAQFAKWECLILCYFLKEKKKEVKSIRAFSVPKEIKVLDLPSLAPFKLSSVIRYVVCCLQGAMVTACTDDQLHLWTLRQKRPEIVHSLKFQRERWQWALNSEKNEHWRFQRCFCVVPNRTGYQYHICNLSIDQ